MFDWRKILENKKLIRIIVSIIFVIVTSTLGAMLLGGFSNEPVKININSNNGISGKISTELKPIGAKGGKEEKDGKDGKDGKEEEKKITVHIKGQVNKPGIIVLNEGQRLHEAVELAGGALESADLNAINLAKLLKDGESIYIPTKGEFIENTLLHNKISGKININSANKEQLTSLPGVGDTIADNIIKFRNSNNGFNSIEDLINVTGIGEKKFDKIKELIEIR